jgi:adenylyltransferase/sulfurtransferase
VRIGPDELAGGAQDRYHRQSLIDWWDQRKVANARVLVIGAGAIGNEVLKCLALMGVGRVLVYDIDRIERSNLSRGVLFREGDEGRTKAEVAAERARDLNPDVRVHPRAENVVHRAGLGVFLWADVVIGAVDNREARVFVNAACARTRRTWVDGAIEGLAGVVRAFAPAEGPCYECTMNATDRRLLAERRSCALLARDVVERGHVPTTAVAASVVGGLQAMEALKAIHGQPLLLGEGLHWNGLVDEVDRVRYPRRDECPGHDALPEIVPLGAGVGDVTLGDLLERAERELGPDAVLDLSRDVILELQCPSCGRKDPGRAVLGEVREREALCPSCGTHRVVEVASSVGRDGPVDLRQTPGSLGVPPFDILTARAGIERQVGWLFDTDAPAMLGSLADSFQLGGSSART